MEKKIIPVLLLTGYLGSGKTTLVNHILTNGKGIKFAVIVNDIGEVNIDADLIEKGGVVNQTDDSLVALQNGCICCTLKTDLMEQIAQLISSERFDYIVIEASGICEPEPIAQTVSGMERFGGPYTEKGIPRVDSIVTVVDALRMQSEFGCGENLTEEVGEDDIENLVIQQIEFCNIILLNKASEVSAQSLGQIRKIISTLQPGAEIIECDYADVDLDKLLYTGMFDYEKVAVSATWIREIESRDIHDEHHHDEDHHGHHHHHHHSEGETEEYGIGTFVYYRRKPFDLNKFDWYVAKKWPASVIRAKGLCYFADEADMSYLFEQAGTQKLLRRAGRWYATAPEEDLEQIKREDPNFDKDWDPVYGDRMLKIVFIGKDMDKEQIISDLDSCLDPS